MVFSFILLQVGLRAFRIRNFTILKAAGFEAESMPCTHQTDQDDKIIEKIRS